MTKDEAKAIIFDHAVLNKKLYWGTHKEFYYVTTSMEFPFAPVRELFRWRANYGTYIQRWAEPDEAMELLEKHWRKP